MIGNRLIDNGAANDRSFYCEWATLANGVAVRGLDMHDTYLTADYSHPGDNIPGLLAIAQQTRASGSDLSLGLLTAYETQVASVTGICLHEHRLDHVAYLAPAVAAGIGKMLKMPTEEIYQAINQSLHLACATRQSRKDGITSWKIYAPAQANKIAIEAVGRVCISEKAPSPNLREPRRCNRLNALQPPIPNTPSYSPNPATPCEPSFAPIPRSTPPSIRLRP